jgi:hypothetical protein
MSNRCLLGKSTIQRFPVEPGNQLLEGAATIIRPDAALAPFLLWQPNEKFAKLQGCALHQRFRN